MRASASILFAIFVCTMGFAQEEQKGLLDRTYNSKPDPKKVSMYQDKGFQNDSKLDTRKAAGGARTFSYDQKTQTGQYKTVRSFFGIKNPWFGKKTFSTSDASLYSKTLVQNAEKEYAVKEEKVRPFYQEDKKAQVKEAFDAKPYLGQGTRPGALAKISEMMEEDLTIDQVREILNKNH